MKPETTPFPGDGSYDGTETPAPPTGKDQERTLRAILIGAPVITTAVTLALVAARLGLLKFLGLLVAVALVGALFAGGILYLIHRGDPEIGVE